MITFAIIPEFLPPEEELEVIVVCGNRPQGHWVPLDAVFVVVVITIFGLEVASLEGRKVDVDAFHTIVTPLYVLKNPI